MSTDKQQEIERLHEVMRSTAECSRKTAESLEQVVLAFVDAEAAGQLARWQVTEMRAERDVRNGELNAVKLALQQSQLREKGPVGLAMERGALHTFLHDIRVRLHCSHPEIASDIAEYLRGERRERAAAPIAPVECVLCRRELKVGEPYDENSFVSAPSVVGGDLRSAVEVEDSHVLFVCCRSVCQERYQALFDGWLGALFEERASDEQMLQAMSAEAAAGDREAPPTVTA